MDQRILLTGGWGQVGFELQRTLAPLGHLFIVDRDDCDLADESAIRSLVREVRPSLVVNPAAYTAVDRAEAERPLAHAINARAPRILGEEASRLGVPVVHFSTDYVFNGRGTSPYAEDDEPGPQNVYGSTKLEGDLALREACREALILRTSWVVGAHGSNFARTILNAAGSRDSLRVVADQYGVPTTAALLADVTAHLARELLSQREPFPYGVYHLVPSGETTWHEYACHVLRFAERAGRSLRTRAEQVEPIGTADYPTAARRPFNSRLSTSKVQQTFQLRLPPWRQALDHTLHQIVRQP